MLLSLPRYNRLDRAVLLSVNISVWWVSLSDLGSFSLVLKFVIYFLRSRSLV